MARVSVGARACWGASREAASIVASPHPPAKPADTRRRIPWAAPQASAVQMASAWEKSKDASRDVSVRWAPTQAAGLRQTRGRWGISIASDKGLRAPFAPYVVVAAKGSKAPWSISLIADLQRLFMGSGSSTLVAVRVEHRATWGTTLSADRQTWVPWGMGRLADVGTVIVVEPGDPADPGSSIIIPVRSTYIVINDVSLVRLPDNTPLQAYELSLQWNSDSWSVGWSATLPASAMDAVMPDSVGSPVELQATVNGTAIRLLAESIGRDRRFGDARLKVSGRGRVAWLANPYAATASRTNDTLLTAQQLADAALAINGVPIGWGLDWQIADWSVPAGVWSHSGAHIEAVQRIAEAAGGYVLGHRTNQTLHVRKRYPLLPWEWSAATPDVVIPAAVASTESIAWTEKPSYNRVFVSGEAGGILGDVKRAGTAGDLTAQMVTDALITAEAAARARGGAILADTGRQASISIQMPVLEETGILDLGQLVEYNDGTQAYRGLVRSVSVRAALPQVWQTVEIETHV